ncbi:MULTISPECIES: hypothetical protein [Bacillaceae]|uniref:Uncharacterized protein n=1 Tax=Evansella alkalicola TaxID=745819 RepID=A0ABS6K2A8_9BACI|nr:MULTISPECIES: hypothetical protein [Bacillaceae]MBU9723882.1 hypothetical protein [Bacillus alkalicola]
MSWREQETERKWYEAFLPNYLKPLRDPQIETTYTKEMINEAVEFLSDLSSLSELPRLNKTFKRNIKGHLFKVKIKPKKLHLELLDTKKSSDPIKKRVYITTYRKQYKMEQGMGKCIDSTIYYQVNNKTVVRSIKKHHLFLTLFFQLHKLDVSLSGGNLDEITVDQALGPGPDIEQNNTHEEEKQKIIHQSNELLKKYKKIDTEISLLIQNIQAIIQECLKDIHLLNFEEKHHVKRMINNDLPNLMETYKSLSHEQQLEKHEDVLESLRTMHTYMEGLQKDVQSSRMDRMEHLLRLNRVRYSEEESK